MADVKLQIKIGNVEFSGEGDQAWVGAQLERVLKAAPAIVTPGPPTAGQTRHSPDSDKPAAPNIAGQPLATFLRDKNASTNQVRKFLATAVWLGAKGRNRLTTADVTRALKDSNQNRLGNPA